MKKFFCCKYITDEGEVVRVYSTSRYFIEGVVEVIYDHTFYEVCVECAEVCLTADEYANAKKTYTNELYFDIVEA
jgi:hypothetical protein